MYIARDCNLRRIFRKEGTRRGRIRCGSQLRSTDEYDRITVVYQPYYGRGSTLWTVLNMHSTPANVSCSEDAQWFSWIWRHVNMAVFQYGGYCRDGAQIHRVGNRILVAEPNGDTLLAINPLAPFTWLVDRNERRQSRREDLLLAQRRDDEIKWLQRHELVWKRASQDIAMMWELVQAVERKGTLSRRDASRLDLDGLIERLGSVLSRTSEWHVVPHSLKGVERQLKIMRTGSRNEKVRAAMQLKQLLMPAQRELDGQWRTLPPYWSIDGYAVR